MPCFSKDFIIRKPLDFNEVFKARNITHFDGFIIYSLDRNLKNKRIGMAISKKNVSHSHQRNQIKRIIRESFRSNDCPSLDYVLVARSKMKYHSKPELRNKLDLAWLKLKNTQNP